MKAIINIKCEGDVFPAEKMITIYSIGTLNEINDAIKKIIEKESTNKGWTIVKETNRKPNGD